MGQDCAGTWEDCRDDGKLGKARKELDRSPCAAGSHGENTAKAFYWEVPLAWSAAPSTGADSFGCSALNTSYEGS